MVKGVDINDETDKCNHGDKDEGRGTMKGTTNSPGKFVTLDTAQTISGAKIFSENLTVNRDTPQFIAKTTKHELGTAPSSNSNVYFVQRDKNDADFVRYQGRYSTSRESRGSITVYNKHSGDTTDTAEFHVYNLYDGTKYMSGPFRTYNVSNATDVVTIGMMSSTTVDADGYALNGLVHNSGNETIAGNKSFAKRAIFAAGEGFTISTGSAGRPLTIRSSGTNGPAISGFLNNNTNLQVFSLNTEDNNTKMNWTTPFQVSSPDPASSLVRNITISSSAPTSSDGNNGDIWITY